MDSKKNSSQELCLVKGEHRQISFLERWGKHDHGHGHSPPRLPEREGYIIANQGPSPPLGRECAAILHPQLVKLFETLISVHIYAWLLCCFSLHP